MKRREARECAFSLLFQIDFWHDDEIESQIELYFEEYPEEIDETNLKFIKEEALGAYSKKVIIDKAIGEYSKDWAISRMAKVDLAILRLATYEIFYNPSIPSGVSVNEAVELAKKYGSDESPAFINGILGKVIDKALGELNE